MADNDTTAPGQVEFSAEEERAMRRGPGEAVDDAQAAAANYRNARGRGQTALDTRALELEGRRRGGFPR